MRLNDQRRVLTRQFARRLHELGFETWVADNQTYGFVTNADGSRIVTFRADGYVGGVSISGAYEPSKENGTGWQIKACIPLPSNPDQVREWFDIVPPPWIRRPLKPYTTRDQHLARYGKSSRYERFPNDPIGPVHPPEWYVDATKARYVENILRWRTL